MPATKRTVSRLSDDDIRAIRALRGHLSGAEIGRLYDRSQASIHAIHAYWTYRYVPDTPNPAVDDRKFDVNEWLKRHGIE